MNDPVAEKLMRRAAAMPALPPPEDKTVTTLYIGNLPENITEDELRGHFYQYGEIRFVKSCFSFISLIFVTVAILLWGSQREFFAEHAS